MYPQVAIVILNFNGKHLLQRFLPSVFAATYPNKTIWIIDNFSTDESVNFLRAGYPEVKIVLNKENFGFAEGYNQGLLQINATYFILLNNDVEVTPGFIEPVINLMEADTTIAFAQPKLLNIKQPDTFEYAGAAGGTIDGIGYPFCRGRILESIEKDEGQFNDDAPVFWATGACMFSRASAYKELSGLYAFFYMQNEDIDLCWRAQNRGYKIVACGQSVVYHIGGGSLAWKNSRKIFYTFRNNLVMITRNMPVARLVWVIPLRMVTDALAALRYLIYGKWSAGFAVIKGIFAYWKWLLFDTTAFKWPRKRGLLNLHGVFRGTIVWQYFVNGKKKYQNITGK